MGQVADAKFRVTENFIRAASLLEKKAKQFRIDAESAPKEKPTPKNGVKPVLTEDELLAKATKSNNDARELYKKGIANIKELFNVWMKPGGRLADITSSKDKDKIKLVTEKAVSLLPWAYDGMRENKSSIKAFTDFLKRFPNSKGAPKAMSRLGMLYIEEDKPEEAAQVFNNLTAKYPEEGKKILPKLTRTMYDLKKYDKSVDAAKKIFAQQNINLSVADMKWMARNLFDCGGKNPKEGAELSLRACETLNKKLKNPNLSEWIGKNKAKALAADPAKEQAMINVLKEQVLFYTGKSAYFAEEYTKSIDALNTLLANPQTPYFWDSHFLRALSFRKAGKPENALDDYGQISMAILGAKDAPESLYFKVQCQIGDTYIQMKKYAKALGSFSGAAIAVSSLNDEEEGELPLKEVSPAEKKEQLRWIGYAVYMAARCQKHLKREER